LRSGCLYAVGRTVTKTGPPGSRRSEESPQRHGDEEGEVQPNPGSAAGCRRIGHRLGKANPGFGWTVVKGGRREGPTVCVAPTPRHPHTPTLPYFLLRYSHGPLHEFQTGWPPDEVNRRAKSVGATCLEFVQSVSFPFRPSCHRGDLFPPALRVCRRHLRIRVKHETLDVEPP